MDPVELEAALVRELLQAWHGFNHTHFRGALRSPRIALGDQKTKLGLWEAHHRTITIGRALAVEQPWGVVLEVLKHEMAHQYAHEVLGARDEKAHGPAFQAVCARLGIDPASGGLPAAGEAQPEQERVVRRIRKLLALADSPNANEAQAAMKTARRLMLEHNLSAAATPGPGAYRFQHLGEPSGRLQEADRLLANLLGAHFFVDVIWVPAYDPKTGKRGRVLEICGTPENLDLAAYVHGFLRETAARLWKAHKREEGIASDRDRQRYLAGVVRGFAEKLAEGARECREVGLVWVGDPGLQGWMRKRHPRVRHVRFGTGALSDAYEDGREAGRNIVLHRPVTADGTVGGTRLLGGR